MQNILELIKIYTINRLRIYTVVAYTYLIMTDVMLLVFSHAAYL